MLETKTSRLLSLGPNSTCVFGRSFGQGIPCCLNCPSSHGSRAGGLTNQYPLFAVPAGCTAVTALLQSRKRAGHTAYSAVALSRCDERVPPPNTIAKTGKGSEKGKTKDKGKPKGKQSGKPRQVDPQGRPIRPGAQIAGDLVLKPAYVNKRGRRSAEATARRIDRGNLRRLQSEVDSDQKVKQELLEEEEELALLQQQTETEAELIVTRTVSAKPSAKPSSSSKAVPSPSSDHDSDSSSSNSDSEGVLVGPVSPGAEISSPELLTDTDFAVDPVPLSDVSDIEIPVPPSSRWTSRKRLKQGQFVSLQRRVVELPKQESSEAVNAGSPAELPDFQ